MIPFWVIVMRNCIWLQEQTIDRVEDRTPSDKTPAG